MASFWPSIWFGTRWSATWGGRADRLFGERERTSIWLALMWVDSKGLDIRVCEFKFFCGEKALKPIPRGKHRDSIKGDNEHNRAVMPAIHPCPYQNGRPTDYFAN